MSTTTRHGADQHENQRADVRVDVDGVDVSTWHYIGGRRVK